LLNICFVGKNALSLPWKQIKTMMEKQIGLNPTQLYLLKLFAQNGSEKSLNELKKVLVE